MANIIFNSNAITRINGHPLKHIKHFDNWKPTQSITLREVMDSNKVTLSIFQEFHIICDKV